MSGTIPSGTQIDDLSLPITISQPVFSHLRFLERTGMTSLSTDFPGIGEWEFDSDNDASWARFKQIELFRTIGARRMDAPE